MNRFICNCWKWEHTTSISYSVTNLKNPVTYLLPFENFIRDWKDYYVFEIVSDSQYLRKISIILNNVVAFHSDMWFHEVCFTERDGKYQRTKEILSSMRR